MNRTSPSPSRISGTTTPEEVQRYCADRQRTGRLGWQRDGPRSSIDDFHRQECPEHPPGKYPRQSGDRRRCASDAADLVEYPCGTCRRSREYDRRHHRRADRPAVTLHSADDPTGGIISAEWVGMCAHVGGIHLANLKIAERTAAAVGDQEFVDKCQEWFERGSSCMEQKV